jgi:predicted ATPase
VERRLARLPHTCVSALTVAAVAGREINADLLARVTGLGIEQVAQRLAPAIQGRMVLDPPGPAGPYRFVHDLIRETVCAGLAPGALAEMHGRLGRALQAALAAGSVVHPAELAEQFLLATSAEDADERLAEVSARYGLLAAAEAITRLAYEDAVGHLQRQMDGLGAVGLLREPIRLKLLVARADAYRRAGDPVAASADHALALQLARRSSHRADLAEVALGVHALGIESGTSRAVVVDLLEEALDGVADEGTELTARVMAALSRELFLSGPGDR